MRRTLGYPALYGKGANPSWGLHFLNNFADRRRLHLFSVRSSRTLYVGVRMPLSAPTRTELFLVLGFYL
jgi:hypothetical protein